MRSKIVKVKNGRGRPKRPREDEISADIDENQNAKKNKTSDESNNQLKLFEERFKDTIKIGIDLFHNRISLSAISFKEKLSYMMILKKIMTGAEWKMKRLISNKQQIECLTRKAIESSKERKDMLSIMEKFVEYKLKSFPGKTRHAKAESVAKHYQCELKCYGVTQELLSTKIDDLVKTIEVTEGPLPKIEMSPKKIIKILQVKRNVCRLCGSKQNLIYSINQKKHNAQLKEVVEFFCRVKINDNNNLPQLVCKGCKEYVENFSKFSERVRHFQIKLDLEAESFVMPGEAIKTEIVDLDYEEDISSSKKNAVDFANESSQDYAEYSADDIEVGANYICNAENAVSQSETRDEIPISEPEIILNTSSSTEEVQDCGNNEISHEISCSEVSTSTPKIPPPPKISSSSGPKECKIILERLPIKHLPSDDEESQESLEEEVSKSKKRKNHPIRPRSSSCLEINYQTIQSSISDLTELKLEILQDTLQRTQIMNQAFKL